MKKTLMLIITSLTIALAGAFLTNNGNWLGFINFLFFISILFLMLGGIAIVLKGGMFEGMFYSFRRFYKGTSKLEGYISEQTGDMKGPSIKNCLQNFSVFPILITGLALFFFTLIASLI